MLAAIGILSGIGCGGELTEYQGGHDFHVRLKVRGGYSGADFSVSLEGATGVLTGESCRAGCVFNTGEVLDRLATSETRWIASHLDLAGIHFLDGTDFGESCCDFTHFDITLNDSLGSSRVYGTVDRLPARIRAVSVALGKRAPGLPGPAGKLP